MVKYTSALRSRTGNKLQENKKKSSKRKIKPSPEDYLNKIPFSTALLRFLVFALSVALIGIGVFYSIHW